jgi:hypothetical protein
MPRGPRRLLLVALVICLATSCGIGSKPASTWTRLNSAIDGFHVPPEFRTIERARAGELCVRPDCEQPKVILRLGMAENLSEVGSCAALKSGVASWPGFEAGPDQDTDATGCVVRGKVGSTKVSATYFGAAGGAGDVIAVVTAFG